MAYTYTTQAQVRAAFWQQFRGVPGISPRRSEALAQRVTL